MTEEEREEEKKKEEEERAELVYHTEGKIQQKKCQGQEKNRGCISVSNDHGGRASLELKIKALPIDVFEDLLANFISDEKTTPTAILEMLNILF